MADTAKAPAEAGAEPGEEEEDKAPAEAGAEPGEEEEFHSAASDMAMSVKASGPVTKTRLLVVDTNGPIPMPAFLAAVRSDVEVVTVTPELTAAQVVAAVKAKHNASGNPPPRNIALWQGIPPKPESPDVVVEEEPAEPEAPVGQVPSEDSQKLNARAAAKAAKAAADAAAEAAEAERLRLAFIKLREDTEALIAGLASLLPTTGSFHVLSPGLLPFNEEHHLLDGEETELMTKLEKASGGRGVMLIRAEPKSDQFLLLARDREVAQVSHVYFLHKELRMWLFARNRTKTGFNPNAVSAGGMNDVGDVKQRVITYLMEIPFLYSVMIGSFLLLFVPHHCTAYADYCSSRENLAGNSAFGEFVLAVNAVTAASFLVSEFFFNKRENFFIDWLDVDDEFPSTHLRHVVDRYPRIKKMLHTHNLRCSLLATWTICVIIVNFAVSAGFVLRHVDQTEKVCCPGIFPPATKIITTLLTNTLLMFLKLLRFIRTTKRSLRETMGISSVHMLPLSYNVIDADHVDDVEDAEPKKGDAEEKRKKKKLEMAL